MHTSRTFAEMRKDKAIGRSEAFRRAMLALMGDEKRPWAAHPSVWAPFVVVGEGGAAQPAAVPTLTKDDASVPSAQAMPTSKEGEAAAAINKKPKAAPAKKAPKDFDPDWSTKIFQ